MPETEILIRMSSDIGELKGQMSAFMESQGEVNKSMAALHAKADTRLESLEKTRTRLFAAATATAAGGGGLGALISKWLGLGGPHG